MPAFPDTIRRLRRHFAITPALPVLLLYASGLAGPVLESPPVLRWLFLLSGLLLALAWQGRRFLLVLWLPALGLAWGAICQQAPWQTYLRLLPRAECAAVIRATVISNPTHAPMPAASAVSEVIAIQAIRLDNHWRPCRGKAILRNAPARPKSPPALPHLRHGDTLTLEGVFLRPPAPLEPHLTGRSYRRHLRSLGIQRLFLARKTLAATPAASWRRPWRWFLERRRVLAKLLTHGIRDPATAGLYQTMLLGGQGAMPRHLRDTFVRSATVHIFSISGLHISSIIAFTLIFLKSFLAPFRLRWVLLMLLLGAYIILTGGAPSAARSFWMTFPIAVAILRFRPTAPHNALAFSGLVLLLVNPFFLASLGFVYSFTLVAVLLYGWPTIAILNDAAHEKTLWLPPDRQRRWRQRPGRWLVAAGGTSGLAWIGSAGLNLYCNGLLTLGAILVNTLLIPVAWCLVILAAPKCLAAALCPPLSAALAAVIESLMDILVALARLGSRPALSLLFPPPSFAWTLLFHALLVTLLATRSRIVRRAALLALAVGLVAATAGNRQAVPPALLICQGDDGAPPALCLLTADGRLPSVLYPGGRASARALATALAARGQHRVGQLYLPAVNSDTAGAAAIITRLAPAAITLPPELPARAAFLRGLTQSAHATGANLTHFAPDGIAPPLQDVAAPFRRDDTTSSRRDFADMPTGHRNDPKHRPLGAPLRCNFADAPTGPYQAPLRHDFTEAPTGPCQVPPLRPSPAPPLGHGDGELLRHVDGPRVCFAPASAPPGRIGALLSYHDARLGLRVVFERVSHGLVVISWATFDGARGAATLQASRQPKVAWVPLK